MKILLITDNHHLTGGAEHYFFALKNQLKQQTQHEVYSVSFGDEAAQGEDYLVLPACQSQWAKLGSRLFFFPRIYWQLRQYLKKIKPDVIHLHNVKQYSHSVLRAIKPYPVVQTIHDYGAVCPLAHNIHRDGQCCATGLRVRCWRQHHVKHPFLVYLALLFAFFKLRRATQRCIKSFFAPSPQLVDYLKQNHYSNATYIPPFITSAKPPHFEKIRSQHFLFVGQLGTHKGIDLLIEEFALALTTHPTLSLTIVGCGPEEKRIRERVQTARLSEQIVFVGWQQDLSSYYEECSALIFPSLWMEAFGLVMSEAMMHARPIIGSNRSSPAWLINDAQTGLLFDPLKKGELAKKIIFAATHPQLMQTFGLQAQQRLPQMIDNEKTLQKILHVYQKIKMAAL